MIESLAAHQGVPVTEIQTWVDSLQESESETEGIPDRAIVEKVFLLWIENAFQVFAEQQHKELQ